MDKRISAATNTNPRRPVPMMVTSPLSEIRAWNKALEAKKPPKVKKAKRVYATGQNPKFPKEREHKQHVHPLRDEHGAYTRTGSPAPNGARRIWLAGISEQRGY